VLAGVDLEFSADLPSDLPGASLFLYITRSEGLGSGALLAMSAGVPVIASKVGGLPEIVVHGKNGLLVDNSPESFAAAMREILNDPAEAARMGAAGRRAAEERFTLGHMVRGTLEVYRKTLL
jgi:glycosyltransferase involved in cell wall biosynthesis